MYLTGFPEQYLKSFTNLRSCCSKGAVAVPIIVFFLKHDFMLFPAASYASNLAFMAALSVCTPETLLDII